MLVIEVPGSNVACREKGEERGSIVSKGFTSIPRGLSRWECAEAWGGPPKALVLGLPVRCTNLGPWVKVP